METMIKEKRRKGLISKTLERCRSFGSKRPATTAGFFSVYVGPGRERFLVRAEHANHPLFQTLLDEAEMEYGYSKGGPLELPCNVELFHRVLGEVQEDAVACGTGRTTAGYFPLGPFRPSTSGRSKIKQLITMYVKVHSI